MIVKKIFIVGGSCYNGKSRSKFLHYNWCDDTDYRFVNIGLRFTL